MLTLRGAPALSAFRREKLAGKFSLILPELELLHIMHEERLGLKQIFRASSDDRDWYTANWSQHGQEMYLKYMRAYHGWAMYLMQPEGVGQAFDV